MKFKILKNTNNNKWLVKLNKIGYLNLMHLEQITVIKSIQEVVFLFYLHIRPIPWRGQSNMLPKLIFIKHKSLVLFVKSTWTPL
jgi:hypothetical protein